MWVFVNGFGRMWANLHVNLCVWVQLYMCMWVFGKDVGRIEESTCESVCLGAHIHVDVCVCE